jgi:hypothetical protein
MASMSYTCRTRLCCTKKLVVLLSVVVSLGAEVDNAILPAVSA